MDRGDRLRRPLEHHRRDDRSQPGHEGEGGHGAAAAHDEGDQGEDDGGDPAIGRPFQHDRQPGAERPPSHAAARAGQDHGGQRRHPDDEGEDGQRRSETSRLRHRVQVYRRAAAVCSGVGELHNHFVEDPRVCDYLADERATLEYQVMTGVHPEQLESLLMRGWRRLGPFYFRPACAGCFECVALRIPVASFTPSGSQERAARRARRFRVAIGAPRVDRARLDLYARWHGAREQRRGWGAAALGAEEYWLQFAYPHEAVRELTLWDGGTLVGVSLCDVTPRAWSAIYFFYDPGGRPPLPRRRERHALPGPGPPARDPARLSRLSRARMSVDALQGDVPPARAAPGTAGAGGGAALGRGGAPFVTCL